MLTRFPHSSATPGGPTGVTLAGATWVDLLDPTAEEQSAVEQAFGLRVPSRAELSEIEASSRLRMERGALYMSAPLHVQGDDGSWVLAPTGFVLSKTVCITVRFARTPAFETVMGELQGATILDPAHAYTRLVEQLVDVVADNLEVLADELNHTSSVIFREDPNRSRLSRDTNRLRNVMTHIGRASDRMSRTHYTMACLDRMAQFTMDRAREWLTGEIVERLETARTDIGSLERFEEDLSNRVQLLQDAATGIIGIGQNDVMKILTVASVVGIPPVLVVGIYGMNFKYMPELHWVWGYPYALALIVASTVLPLIWFKKRGWI
jgi:magnesium transporter